MATKRKDANRTQRRFDRRWLELTGERYRPGGRVPAPLVNSLSSLVFAPTRVPRIFKMRQPVPDVVVFARKHEGKDCDERAEIAGWYSCNHNGFCIGRAAVLKNSQRCSVEALQQDRQLPEPLSLQLCSEEGPRVLHPHGHPGGGLSHAGDGRMELLLLIPVTSQALVRPN